MGIVVGQSAEAVSVVSAKRRNHRLKKFATAEADRYNRGVGDE